MKQKIVKADSSNSARFRDFMEHEGLPPNGLNLLSYNLIGLAHRIA